MKAILAFLARLFGRRTATNHVPPARHTPPAIPASCDRIIDLLLHLCDGDKKTADWLLCWLAYPLQNPGAKLNTAIVMHGDQGTGKNLFFEDVMLPMYGEHGHVMQPAYLDGVFNTWASNKRFVLVDNFDFVSRSHQFYSKVKCLIANSGIAIEERLKPARLEANQMNFVFLSQPLPDRIAIGSNRRFIPIRTGSWKSSAFFAPIFKQIRNDDGVEAFRQYLLHDVDCSAWDEFAKPSQVHPAKAEATA